MSKAELVAVLMVITPAQITEKMLNAMTVPVLKGLLSHFGGDEVVEEKPVVTTVGSRTDFVGDNVDRLKSQHGVDVAQKLSKERYLVVLIDTENLRNKKDGSVGKMVAQTKMGKHDWKAFRETGVLQPESWYEGKKDYPMTPVFELEDGREVLLEVNCLVQKAWK